jgi:uncharacterized protein YjdB
MPDGYTFYTKTNDVNTAFTALSGDYKCAIGIAWNSTLRTSVSDPTELGAGISTDYQGSFVIPSMLSDQGYQVTEIGYKAFYKCKGITSVSIPSSITYIDVNAFNGCTSLTQVVIPGSVSIIDQYAFMCCHNLRQLILQDGIKTIEYNAFLGCKSLESVDIPASVTTIGSEAFGGAQINHDGYGYGSYEGCNNIKSVIVHWDNPIKLYSGTFSNAAGAVLYVPKGTYDKYANANGWKEFGAIKEIVSNIDFKDEVVKNICVANWDSNGDGELSEKEAADVTSIGTVFQNNTEITSFSEFKYFTGVTTIDDSALYGCTNLTTIEFPSSLTTIERYALYNSGFESLVFPDNVTSIGNSAVRNCTSLASVKIGRNSVKFGKNVFRSCTSLSSITFEGTECHFNGEDAFRACSALTSVVISDISAWCKSTFYSNSNPLLVTKSLLLQTSENSISEIKHLAIPDDITTINNYAFYGCEGLESIVIPSNVTAIGNNAFNGCNLTSVTTETTEPIAITSYVFSNRANASLYVPAGRKAAYEAADYWKEFKEIIEMPSQYNEGDVFTGKTLEGVDMTFKVISNSEKTCQVGNGSSAAISTSYEGNITIPSAVYGYKVTNIGCRAFKETDITSVVIPTTIDVIETEAFYDCTNLAFIDFPSTINYIGYGALDNTQWYNDKEDGVIYVGRIAYKYKGEMPELSIITIDEGTESISPGAFSNNKNLMEINLPPSITSIGESCFYGCSNMELVRAGMTEPVAISSSTFTNVENIFLYVPDGSADLYLTAENWQNFLCIKQASDPEMFSGGDGTAASPFIINTVGDFRVLARDVNNGDSYVSSYFKVGKSEIDFSGVSYTAIGKCRYDAYGNEVPIAFSGNFDGNGVTIMNLSANKGLFGYIGKKGVVANIIIDESCKIDGNTSNVAGIAGSNRGTIDNCINKAPVSSTYDHVGGICGDNMGTISNCKNYGDVTGPYDVGGIFGSIRYSSTIICDNMVSGCTIKGTRGSGSEIYRAAVIGPFAESSTCSNNFYTPDVVLIVGNQTYDGKTPRGAWDNKPGDVTENCAAMLLPDPGSEAKPFTCGEANAFASELTADTPTETEYFVKGKVSRMEDNFGYQDGNATFYISDDGTKNGEFYVYHTLYFDKQNYNGGRVPNLGDEVVLCGKLTNFNGTTPETVDKDCRLVSINGKTVGTGLEVGDLFMAKTPENVEMFFVVDKTGMSMGKASEIGCSVGYAAANRPDTYTNPPCCINANYDGVITIPATAEGFSIQVIAPSAFANAKVTSVIIPSTVYDIELNAFKDCQNLASVTLPEGVILNNGTFQNCTALTSIELPKNVQLWASETIFGGCTNLTTITVNDETPCYLQGSILVDDPSKVTLHVPVGSKAAYEAADYWKEFKEIVEPKVKLSKNEATIEKGKTLTLKATLTPSDLTDKTVTWESSNTAIATVTSAGKVKGVKAGTVIITCTSQTTGAKATCKVTVGYVKLDKTEAVIEKGKTVTLAATVYPSSLTDKAVTWESSNTKVATVTSAGKVNGVKAGTATITCTSKATGAKATCKVTVGYVKLDKTEAVIEKGKTLTLTATVYPSSLTDKTVTWKSSNTKIATVSTAGKVKGVKAGTVTITATSKATGLKKTCTVTVGYVKLDQTKATLLKGKTLTLTATVYPSSLTDKSVTWKSSNKAVATVTSAGKVKGVKAGTATITCTSKATGLKTTCTVTVVNGKVTLNKTEVRVQKGKTVTLKATVTPTSLKDKSVTWKSSNTKIATVTADGKVKGIKAGTATIICTSNATGKKSTCTVTVLQSMVSLPFNGDELLEDQEMENPGVEEPFDVYDLNGRMVKSQVTSLDGLPSGIYIVNGKKILKK